MASKNWRSFPEAREFARALKLKSSKVWYQWAKTSQKPLDIPAQPHHVYRNKGWISWGDWLGKINKAGTPPKQWCSFTEAREFARPLKLKSSDEWWEWVQANPHKKPENIPASVRNVYKNQGWQGWGDFLGTGNLWSHNRTYRPYDLARSFAQRLQFKNGDEWAQWAKTKEKPIDIPAAPDAVYKEQGWQGWGDFLGTGNISPVDHVFRPFEEARVFAHCLELKSFTEWAYWAKSPQRPKDIPTNPKDVYPQEWKDWGDFLGTNNISPTYCFRPFEEARLFARTFKFNSRKEWNIWAKTGEKPKDIPKNPHSVYRQSGWISWGDWLGHQRICTKKEDYRNFYEARAFARKTGISTGKEWMAWAKTEEKPKDIPIYPLHIYRDQWKGWADWLGTGKLRPNLPKPYHRPFEEARAFVRSLGLKSFHEWGAWLKLNVCPKDIPHSPAVVYRNEGWISFYDWLGTEPIQYRPFEEARAYVHSLGLSSQNEWLMWCRSKACPKNIPHSPGTIYRNKGWKGMTDWLGREKGKMPCRSVSENMDLETI